MLQRPVVQRQRIGPAIRKLRHEQSLTLDDLAAQAGISASHLSRLERGQTLPSFTVLAGIAHVLGVSIDEFAQLEQDVTVLDHDLGDMLTSLGLAPQSRDEFLSLSIESRRVLARVITALAAMPITESNAQEQAVRAVVERGLVESSQSLMKLIASAGLSPVGFTRALIWLNTAPGQKRMLLAKPGLIGMPAPRFSAEYRALTGSDPIAPEIAAWWEHTERATDIRTIVARTTIRGYIRDGAWFKGGPVSTPEEREAFVERVTTGIDNGDLEFAITDAPLGDVNIRMSEDDVLLETTRHRGPVEQLGLIIRGHEAASTFANAFEDTWNGLPADDRDPSSNKAWLRDQLPAKATA
jgi:transcriptional regulator with XRE-family HTH domain